MIDADDRAREEISELFRHEDDHAKDRTDWFFVGHAILVEAFFSATSHHLGGLLVAIVGFWTAVYWLLIGLRQYDNLEYLRARYAEASDVFKKMQENRANQKPFRDVRASPVFLKIIPLIFIGFWLLAGAGSWWCWN